MRFEATDIASLVAVMLTRHADARGSFARLFCRDEFAAHGLANVFVQASLSVTPRAGTLRGQVFELSPESDAALCSPEGCAHGFLTLTDDCEVLYQMSVPYAPDFADGVRYDDPALGIVWPRPVALVAEKDLAWPAID